MTTPSLGPGPQPDTLPLVTPLLGLPHIVSLAVDQSYDVAILFSQDQDLSEAVDEVKRISALQDRWVKLTSAFPYSPTPMNPRHQNGRGVNGTDWIRIDQAAYTQCLDPKDYRPARTLQGP
jgi:hypothetical protein